MGFVILAIYFRLKLFLKKASMVRYYLFIIVYVNLWQTYDIFSEFLMDFYQHGIQL